MSSTFEIMLLLHLFLSIQSVRLCFRVKEVLEYLRVMNPAVRNKVTWISFRVSCKNPNSTFWACSLKRIPLRVKGSTSRSSNCPVTCFLVASG